MSITEADDEITKKAHRRYASLDDAVEGRDVKGVLRVLTDLQFEAASDPRTANYIHLAMQHLSAGRRNWEDIATKCSRAVSAAKKAEEAGVSRANIALYTQHRDLAIVSCKQAEQRLGRIPARAFWNHKEETMEALKRIQDKAGHYIRTLEKGQAPKELDI